MANPARRPTPSEPPQLHDRAMDNLRFIRTTMEKAAGVTAVSGWGIAATGVVGSVAGSLALVTADQASRLILWLVAAPIGLGVSGVCIVWKAHRSGDLPMLRGAARKLALAFLPPMSAGALLTLLCWRTGMVALFPALWLLLYGTAVVAAGTWSVRSIPVMGAVFMALGTVAAIAPMSWGNALLLIGFGGVHLLFGPWIARQHGG
jgi:hypothetical protein